ncbi:MAG: hypothetical protein ACFFC7_11365 [Candidatus Hermodarchaeota archaeon]
MKRIIWIISLFTVGGVIGTLLSFLLGRIPIDVFFYLSLSSFYEIFVLGPFIAGSLYLIYRDVGAVTPLSQTDSIDEKIRWIMRFLFVLFIEGYGIHFAANEIHTNEGYQFTPTSLTYFYDELFGHWLTYFSVLGIILCIVALQFRHPQEESLENQEIFLLFGSSIFLALIVAYALIEGQTPFIAFTVLPISVILVLIITYRQKCNPRMLPMAVFFIIMAVFAIVFVLTYGIVFSGWPQPSELP